MYIFTISFMKPSDCNNVESQTFFLHSIKMIKNLEKHCAVELLCNGHVLPLCLPV